MLYNALWRTAANRLYYACYYAATALMVQYGYQTYTHSGLIGLIGLFGLHFMTTGQISDETGFVLRQLYEMRQKAITMSG
ncbi:MAG: HEPN domain-containing protein [Dysgonamonadaceae bacterium]|nr:HEPN domain-containing protein [Dysgonamonadaceae bacterium]